MEILINELSLTGQFDSTEQFLKDTLLPVSAILKEIKENEGELYIKKDLWSCPVTTTLSLDRVLKTKKDDIVTRFKLLLQNRLFWEDSQKHSLDHTYVYSQNNAYGSSLAETCERDKIVVSFIHPDFSFSQLIVIKDETDIMINNLFKEGDYIAAVKNRGMIVTFSLKDSSRFTRTFHIEQGQHVYRENDTGYYWYLDNFHKDHFEVFDSKGVHIGIADLEGQVNTRKRDTTKRVHL
jgi:hypothetical protein